MMMTPAEYIWVGAGFHTTVLPISAGAVARLAAMEVKLKGEMANTNPSSARYSVRFHIPGLLIGCDSYTSRMNWTLKRKKSIISHAASISA